MFSASVFSGTSRAAVAESNSGGRFAPAWTARVDAACAVLAGPCPSV